MQYPVPQFTDVEDKIIGPLTLKQFIILFAAGILVFLGYSATKSLGVAIIFFIFFGFPAIAVAFGKSNGRPLYKTLPMLLNFILSPKVLVFYKEAPYNSSVKVKDADIAASKKEVKEVPKENTKTRLKEINRLLDEQARAEAELVRGKR